MKSPRALIAAISAALIGSGCISVKTYWCESPHTEVRPTRQVLENGPYKASITRTVVMAAEADGRPWAWIPDVKARIAKWRGYASEDEVTRADQACFFDQLQMKERGYDYVAAYAEDEQHGTHKFYLLGGKDSCIDVKTLFASLHRNWPDVFTGNDRRKVRFRIVVVHREVDGQPRRDRPNLADDAEITVYLMEGDAPARKKSCVLVPQKTVDALAVFAPDENAQSVKIRTEDGEKNLGKVLAHGNDFQTGVGDAPATYEELQDRRYMALVFRQIGGLMIQLLNEMTEDELKALPKAN